LLAIHPKQVKKSEHSNTATATSEDSHRGTQPHWIRTSVAVAITGALARADV